VRIPLYGIVFYFLGCGQAGEVSRTSYLCMRDGTHCHDPINGKAGIEGREGVQGVSGESGRPGTDGSPGPAGPIGNSGSSGSPGAVGPQGNPGQISLVTTTRFSSGLALCTSGSGIEVDSGVDSNSSNVLDLSEITATTVICDGTDAPPSPYTVDHVHDPCGHQAAYDEVLLVMGNGQILAHFASGANQFLTLIGPGSYVTTDGTGCYFTIDAGMNIINEHN
jgi:hypothetical protein